MEWMDREEAMEKEDICLDVESKTSVLKESELINASYAAAKELGKGSLGPSCLENAPSPAWQSGEASPLPA